MNAVDSWLAALEARHLANLTRPELTRALRALSSCYVERRDKLPSGAALEGAGKRAAFALFYGPLHFVTVMAVVRARLAHEIPLDTIADMGCGTGVGGAAWAAACTDVKPPTIGERGHVAERAVPSGQFVGVEAGRHEVESDRGSHAPIIHPGADDRPTSEVNLSLAGPGSRTIDSTHCGF